MRFSKLWETSPRHAPLSSGVLKRYSCVRYSVRNHRRRNRMTPPTSPHAQGTTTRSWIRVNSELFYNALIAYNGSSRHACPHPITYIQSPPCRLTLHSATCASAVWSVYSYIRFSVSNYIESPLLSQPFAARVRRHRSLRPLQWSSSSSNSNSRLRSRSARLMRRSLSRPSTSG